MTLPQSYESDLSFLLQFDEAISDFASATARLASADAAFCSVNMEDLWCHIEFSLELLAGNHRQIIYSLE
jgi:hypothetical protein